MLKKNIILILISLSFNGVSQIELIAEQKTPRLYSPNNYIDSLSSLSDFPEFIQKKSKDILKWYTGEFYDSIYFIKGQNIDLIALNEKGYFKDSTSIFEYYETERTIPKYELYFGLTDISINLKRIIIKLTFDEYGQILEFHWPFYINKKIEFQDANKVLSKLEEYRENETIKKPTDICFRFNNEMKNFVWEFTYDESEINPNFNGVYQIAVSFFKIPAFENENK